MCTPRVYRIWTELAKTHSDSSAIKLIIPVISASVVGIVRIVMQDRVHDLQILSRNRHATQRDRLIIPKLTGASSLRESAVATRQNESIGVLTRMTVVSPHLDAIQ
jgi:hypothetical protein